MYIPVWLNDILNLFFPNVCQACGEPLNQQEKVICISCQLNLPETGFHLHEDNPVSKVFWGRVDLNAATSFLFFNKGGNVQKLIHSLKYKNKKEVGEFLGDLLGRSLINSPYFENIDVVVPVPLHPKKYQTRGFNQSEIIASGIANAMNITNDFSNLVRLVNTDSQTRKSRLSRWENVKSAFGIRDPEKFSGKHILLVDDVLTTGATIEACASKILDLKNTKVSVATLAYAQG